MFYLGVYLEEAEGTAQVVVVEKSFYTGSKKYRIVHVANLQETNRASLTKALLSMRLDERWTAVKKVFSQSGRPPKTKIEPPLILLSSWDDGLHMAVEMRGRCASVEVVVGSEPDETFRARLKADAFHNCHVVTAGMMVASLSAALANKSLSAEQMTTDLAAPLSSLSQALLADPENIPPMGSSFPWLSALGSCLWHGESIRRIKRY